MKIYALKTCDTCRKAIRILQNSGKQPEILDVRLHGIPSADLARFFEDFGDDLINRRSTTWRKLTEDERSMDVISMIENHPTLMKRPLIESDGALFLGWSEETQSALLG